MGLSIYLNEDQDSVYESNITHNLTDMAKASNLYFALWRPEEINCTLAKDIIILLEYGLEQLESNPEYFKTFNSVNGWGIYKRFVPFVSDYIQACKKYPDAIIEVSR
tara:strand:- start:489 stop:809 length:321 start_codon:yes stop_codon:yes gene_type:complete